MDIASRFRLDGRTALVTGAGRGIGRACAIALAQAGADVWLAARTREEVERAAGEIRAAGGKAHAVEGLTKAMALELAPHGIRVVSIAPTFIETPMTRPMMSKPEFAQWVKDRIPAGRVGQPEDVAAAVVFAASSAASLVTGTSLVVDGG